MMLISNSLPRSSKLSTVKTIFSQFIAEKISGFPVAVVIQLFVFATLVTFAEIGELSRSSGSQPSKQVLAHGEP